MILFHINDIKKVTTALFINNIFDNFLLVEGNVTTFATFSISGKLNKEYFSQQESVPSEEYSTWENVKPIFFQIIKGKNLPINFKIVLALNPNIIHTISDNALISGMYLNIKFENNNLTITTGISHHSFSLDKSGEEAWDSYIKDFLTKNELSFDIY